MNNENKNNVNKGYSAASLIVGIIAIVISPIASLIMPILVLLLGLTAIILGAKSLNTQRKKTAIAGIVLGVIAVANLAYIFISFRVPFTS